MEWLDSINRQLDEQYYGIQRPFEDLIKYYNECLQRESAAHDHANDLEFQINQLKTTAKHQGYAKNSSDQSGAVNLKQYRELQIKYKALKEEQTELLTLQGQNSQKLFQMNEQIQQNRLDHEAFEREKKALLRSIDRKEAEISDAQSLLTEKDFNIQILQDELQALQLELLKTDERNKSLKIENDQLVTRWLQKVNESVKQYNDHHQNASITLPDSARRESGAEKDYFCQLSNEIRATIDGIVFCAPFLLPCCRGGGGDVLFNIYNLNDACLHQLFTILPPPPPRSRPPSISPASNFAIKQAFICDDSLLALLREEESSSSSSPSSSLIVHWSLSEYKQVNYCKGVEKETFLSLAYTKLSKSFLILSPSNILRMFKMERFVCLWTEDLYRVVKEKITEIKMISPTLLALFCAGRSNDGVIYFYDIEKLMITNNIKHSQIQSFQEINQLVLACTLDNSIILVDPLSTKSPILEKRALQQTMAGHDSGNHLEIASLDNFFVVYERGGSMLVSGSISAEHNIELNVAGIIKTKKAIIDAKMLTVSLVICLHPDGRLGEYKI